MDEFKAVLAQISKSMQFELDENMLRCFADFYSLLVEWNNKINLTAITDPSEVIIKHFIDSLSVLKFIDIPKGSSVIDVGSGAGFPGIPLKIVRPDLNITLLDSINKRIIYLKDVSQKLQLGINFINSRAEEAAHKQEYREKFDFAVSRAVAPMNILSEYCIPFVRDGGIFIAMKSKNYKPELDASQRAVERLGGAIINAREFMLPDASFRAIISVQKMKKTEIKFPRHGSKIANNPL